MDQLTRREMLAASASVAAGLAASGCSQNGKPVAMFTQAASPVKATPVPLGPDEPLKVGFIGIGGRGRGLLDAFLKLPNQQVVALCDINKENLDKAAAMVEKAQGKAPQTFGKDADDFKNLLDRKDIHAIVTATPCFEHPRIMLATIAAGKHIYGEKPLALTVADADACLAAAEANKDLVVQVGFQWMASPRFQECIERIRRGDIGRLVEGRFFRHNGSSPLIGWFSDRAKSGDWMLEQACHEYNIMNWVAGTTPIKAYGMGWSNLYQDVDPGRNVTDYYAAIIEYPDNFIVHYAHGWISPDGFREFAQKAIGTKGAVELGGDRISRSDGQQIEPLKSPKGDDTAFALKAFVDSIRDGKPAVAPVSYGRNATLLALMVRKAVYERREVTWKEMLRTC
ncbi:MAG TPA: Gfo/Idh/MocA family oxidoreductase [Phycisphaerae bacterium]|nr:Gfo/Idh/MocA family oxidoreductase [Phycisphaerae bacterium]HOB72994.1 Gfo/Idh/MocA family oxidoreductase [Phycisphaerae bacterium]HOJ52957.1 Gfo/Idh/MocA family oxidoreductase [Phycisphaerae bacterium]HOL24694.1 Gfo/Idh/MocA family oxidoreductase [Phycisphaerae bacterium]HPP19230.1 Gfo/Idh/MocA family oxidoreductase [Phycisphaerae bacterium]